MMLSRKDIKESSVSVSKAIGVTKSLVSKISQELLKDDMELHEVCNKIKK